MKICSSINLPWGQARSYKKLGPDRFSRFDVYWIQTNKQTDRQAKFIYSKITLLDILHLNSSLHYSTVILIQIANGGIYSNVENPVFLEKETKRKLP